VVLQVETHHAVVLQVETHHKVVMQVETHHGAVSQMPQMKAWGGVGAGEDAATDSSTGVAADSATEDNEEASAEGDEGADAADDGVWGCTEEQGVDDCADDSDIAAGPTQSSLSHKEVRQMLLQIEHQLLPKDSDMHFTLILHRGGNRHWEHEVPWKASKHCKSLVWSKKVRSGC